MKSIFYYKISCVDITLAAMALSVVLPPRSMRSIRLVIPLLYPCDQRQHSVNRIRPQRSDDLQEGPQLRHGEGWRFFSPSAVSVATERNAPALSSAYGDATPHICGLHSDPYPARFCLLRSIVQWPTADHLTRQRYSKACS